ncbi:MAG: DUF1841 family protein, partial [Proteobacteria bacterium]|nr:DUF1841 family protein [Pseudomonadota bacterium]
MTNAPSSAPSSASSPVATAAAPASAANPLLDFTDLPLFDRIAPEHVAPALDRLLADADAALAARYDGSDAAANPFLHLAMHLAISEQCSIDQPRGIRQAVELLCRRRGSLHDAHHE